MDDKVLLLGELASESIVNDIKKQEMEYVNKSLKSSVKNWNKVISMIEHSNHNDKYKNKFGCIIAKFTESVLLRACTEEYKSTFYQLCNLISEYPNLILIYKDNLYNKFTLMENKPYSFMGTNRFYKLDESYSDSIKEIISFLNNSKLNLAPYMTRLDIANSVQSFFEDTYRGFIFRLYAAKDRIWENEIDKLLNLFRDYLDKVSGIPITYDENRTQRGTIYTFYCNDKSLRHGDFRSKFDEFSAFLELCTNDISKASMLLRQLNISEDKIDVILTRYIRETKRLLIDINYERERRLLSIQHRLNSEILDLKDNLPLFNIGQASSKTNENINNGIEILGTSDLLQYENIIGNASVVNINNPQIVSHVQGIVCKEILGDIQYTDTDKQLLKLFDEYASKDELIELRSSLDILKDISAPDKIRTSSWKKLQGFVLKNASVIGKVGINLLEKYLEKKFIG